MSENKQPIDECEEKPDHNQAGADRTGSSGIGGGLVGVAIGGLLGRRVGGIFGAVVGATAGGLVGRGTAVCVNRTVKSIENAANSVSETVNHNVNSVGTVLKDTIQEIKPSVISVLDAVKDTVDEVKPSVVGTANNVAEGVNYSIHGVNNVVDTVKDTVDEVKPSVIDVVDTVVNTVKDTIEEIKLSVDSDEDTTKDTENQAKSCDRDNSDLDQKSVVTEPPLTTQATKLENKNIQPTPEELETDNQKTAQQFEPEKPQRIEFQIGKIPTLIGAIIGAVAFISLGSISGFSPKENYEVITLRQPASNQSLTSTGEIADGWIFIGNINNTSTPAFSGKSLVKGSQSTDSPIVPSVGTIVTVNVEPGLTLRENVPQKPNFSYQEQKVLDVLQPPEKLKILKVEFITSSRTTKPVTSVWAKVYRCGSGCY
ncbi:hypothetical protein IQ247_06085 [Plectonema cf. radiosum LEGE 06105]|uniref:Glycine zipper 2TM domain-containing protein n=1 Tax=Plectonema cf. radiosum LEGE 06105 TaxID=945769 RepID=A0A8J7JZD1_9CYAN|nr:hypothetical protein [Plectonema radiosum]MBE9212281.1 hypothetical protein [Plectonema cf. radiosum LEGE 06105]